MDFITKKENFSDNYNNIKKLIKKAIKDKNVMTGSGGSDNIIILYEDFVLKIVPNFNGNLYKKKPNHDYLEADIYKKLTNEFVETNKTPHIVGIYKRYLLEDIKMIFPKDCLTFEEKIMTPFDKKPTNVTINHLCNLKVGYNKQIIEKKASVLALENCPDTIASCLVKILKKSNNITDKIKLFNQFIKRIIFQGVFTLALIQDSYPKFIHNDLFLRNILAINEYEYEFDDYVQYNFKSKSYFILANGIYIKINDFGYSLNILKGNSTLEDQIANSIYSNFEIANKKRDIYTFLYDLYNPNSFGAQSIITVIINNIKQKSQQQIFIKNFKKELGKYFNYKIIDKVNSNNQGILDWMWDVSESKILMDSIKKPIDYFKAGMFDFLTKIPDNARIVKIYNLE